MVEFVFSKPQKEPLIENWSRVIVSKGLELHIENGPLPNSKPVSGRDIIGGSSSKRW